MRANRGRVPAARGAGAAVPRADLGGRAHGQPADPAVPGRRRGGARASAAAPAQARGARPGQAGMAAAGDARAVCDAGAVLVGPRQGGGEPGVLLRAVRVAVRAAARRGLATRALAALPGHRGRAGADLRGDRLRGVRAQGTVPQPEGRGGEPVRQLLPRELAVLRPEHLRALSCAGDDRGDDGGAVVAQHPRRARGGGGAGMAARGAGDELLAVEHRGAAARPGGAGGLPLVVARDAVSGRRASSRWRSWWWRWLRRAGTSA